MAKKDACSQCSKAIGGKGMSEAGKKFCCENCCTTYKKGHPAKAKVCEFC